MLPLTRFVPRAVLRRLVPLVLQIEARRHGLTLRRGPDGLDITRDGRTIRLALDHAIYARDVLAAFDYYATAVDGATLVDFSGPRAHGVVGFPDFPIRFPSLPEPFPTASQYLTFAQLAPGMTVLDLGAYSGLTSILFSRAVSIGRVIAVEPDPQNLACVVANIATHVAAGGDVVEVVHAAVWSHTDGLAFSTEGNMGSSAAEIVGGNRGTVHHVPTVTLSALAERYRLNRVDFIKCDIEGAERVIFKDRAFFARFRPRIIIEPHVVKGRLTSDACVADLTAHGYRCTTIPQHGVSLPLIECQPPR